MDSTRFRRISGANIGTDWFHQNRTVSWQIPIPRSAGGLHVAERERVPHVHHHHEAHDLGG
jgi:hypothetical protein